MANLPDLPPEILLQILSYFMEVVPLGQQPFWDRRITQNTLLPFHNYAREERKHGEEQVRMAKNLSLMCRRMRTILAPLVWARFGCSDAVELRNLRNACASQRELGSYVQYLDLQISLLGFSLPSDLLSPQLLAVWPRLSSLHSLTLTFSPDHPCPPWLVDQLRDVLTLRSLSLRLFGSSFGSHLRSLPQLSHLSIEIHPPDARGQISLPESEDPTPRETYHNWTGLFNNVVDMVDSCVKEGNVKSLGIFVHWTMVHSFYRHVESSPSISSLLALPHQSDRDSGVQLGPSIKRLAPSNLAGLSSLSLTLESQMGTGPFLRAVRGLPITDLALVSYDLSLLSGTVFKDFCSNFGKLKRLRLKLRDPSIGVGGGGPAVEGFINQDAFIQGLASLKHLEAYKGPILFQRYKPEGAQLKGGAQLSLRGVVSALKESGTLNPDLLLQWHVWLDGVYGPKEYWMMPSSPATLGGWDSAPTRTC